ncbi:MAG TPA: hypothetical protein VFQ60_01175 [Patescibacteria group bacterium]|nr:hypothetical protein [Patescibacteria group bacterium]
MDEQTEDYASGRLYKLSETLGKRRPWMQCHGALGGTWGYGQDFKNSVFEMHPFWYGECTCGVEMRERAYFRRHPHAPTCAINRYHREFHRLLKQGASREELSSLETSPSCDCGVETAYLAWIEASGFSLACANDCRRLLPNFRVEDLEIRWYKWIGRDMEFSRDVSIQELESLFKKCFDSLLSP